MPRPPLPPRCQHSLLGRAPKVETVPARIPEILLKLERNQILEGVIDLAFEENGTWHVVDFKTDAGIRD